METALFCDGASAAYGCAVRRAAAVRFGAYFTVVPASSRVLELLVYNLNAPTASGDELYALQRAQRVFFGQAELAGERH